MDWEREALRERMRSVCGLCRAPRTSAVFAVALEGRTTDTGWALIRPAARYQLCDRLFCSADQLTGVMVRTVALMDCDISEGPSAAAS